MAAQMVKLMMMTTMMMMVIMAYSIFMSRRTSNLLLLAASFPFSKDEQLKSQFIARCLTWSTLKKVSYSVRTFMSSKISNKHNCDMCVYY